MQCFSERKQTSKYAFYIIPGGDPFEEYSVVGAQSRLHRGWVPCCAGCSRWRSCHLLHGWWSWKDDTGKVVSYDVSTKISPPINPLASMAPIAVCPFLFCVKTPHTSCWWCWSFSLRERERFLWRNGGIRRMFHGSSPVAPGNIMDDGVCDSHYPSLSSIF